MSKDKIRPLLKAVADLPETHTGFVLDIVNKLRGEDPTKVRMVIGHALTSLNLNKGIGFGTQAECGTVTVTPGLFSDRVAAGKYDCNCAVDDITVKHAPHDPVTVGEWEWDLVGYGNSIYSESAKKSIEVEGWLAAQSEHILAYGAAYPEVQRKCPIVALGSVSEVGGNPYVIALWSDGAGRRGIGLYDWKCMWSPYCHFLRVRKISNSKSLIF